MTGTWFLGIEAGCTTVLVPGWAAVAVVLIAAAPRLAREVLGHRRERGDR